jgi:hypothetical protein
MAFDPDAYASTSAPAGFNPDAYAGEEPKPGLLRRVAGAVAPGVFALFKGTPENRAEHEAFAKLTGPDVFIKPGASAEAANALQELPAMGALTFAPMGSAPTSAVRAGKLSQYLDKKSIEEGRKALSGIGTPLSARKEIPEAVVREALDSGAIRPFRTVADTAQKLETQADTLGTQYGGILKALESKGVVGPNAKALASKLTALADDAKANSLGSSRPETLNRAASELTGATTPVNIPAKPTVNAAGDLGLMQSENIKRQLQFEAQREYDKITRQYTTAGETKKELASLMRSAIEDAVQRQSSLAPEEAAAFEPVKARLSRTLGALKVAEEGAARAARRKPVSLTSTIVGSAAGAASHDPIIGLGSALLHGVADARLASTLAAGANRGARWLGSYRAPEAFSGVPSQALDPMVRELMQAMSVKLRPASANEESR